MLNLFYHHHFFTSWQWHRLRLKIRNEKMLLTMCIDAISCPAHPSLPADTLFAGVVWREWTQEKEHLPLGKPRRRCQRSLPSGENWNLLLGLPSTINRHEALQKRFSNRWNLKTPPLRFSVDGKHYENEACRQLWRYDNHVISLTEFPQTQIQTERWLLRCKFLRRSVDGKDLMLI